MSEAVAGYFLFALILLSLFVYPWYFRCLNNLSSKMEKEYTEQWVLLGSPSLSRSMSLSGSISLLRFVWLRKYMSLDDAFLIALGNKTRSLLLIGILIFVMILAVSWLV